MTSPRPAIVFLHGAYHRPWVWEATMASLPEYLTFVVASPSSGPTLGSLEDDTVALQSTLEAIAAPVVVVAHSFGGVLATQALDDRSRVKGIVYVAALVPDLGQSASGLGRVADGDDPNRPDDPAIRMHSGTSEFPAAHARLGLYHDLDDAAAAKATALLVPTSRNALSTPVTRTAWRQIPSSYVICTSDALLTARTQDEMASRTERTHRLESSHSPMLSQPKELARIVREEAALFMNHDRPLS